MLGHSHKLHMGIAHVFNILSDCLCKFSVCVKTFILSSRMTHPGPQVYLINRHWIYLVIPCLTRFHPSIVRPFQMRDICHPGCRTGSQLRIVCKGIRLKDAFPLLCLNTELVEIPLFYARNKERINPQRLLPLHVICFKVPAIEITNHRNPACMGCPNRKIDSFFSAACHFMRTHFLIDLIMISLTEKILVKLTDLIRL